ncbi:hypothetical protein WJX74_001323 [Apatococcus lobatus]|uniref:Calcineurin-like phosphoesterase domain-containing protein n=1 Tax=Apatococcus lobatus TaxID=904363 RepID=A0AAW1RDA3_9CHLO
MLRTGLVGPKVFLLPRALRSSQAAVCTVSRMAVSLPPPPPGGSRLAIIGDIGEENLALAQLMSQIPQPKAVILGNHDGWQHSKSKFGRDYMQQHDGAQPDPAAIHKHYKGVLDQLDAFGPDHIGYGAKHFAAQNLSVVGARPCSWGGKRWRLGTGICEDLFGVMSMAESTSRIQHHICSQPAGSTVVVMGHNGPTGLGALRHDICGIDWQPEQGDNGDPDLRAALDGAHQQGAHVPLVVFGHMHHALRRRGGPESFRNMVHIDASTGTVCLDAAVVPRWRDTKDSHLSHFTVADISKDRIVTFAAHVWVKTERMDSNGEFQRCSGEVVAVEELLQQLPAEASVDCVLDLPGIISVNLMFKSANFDNSN